MDLQDFFPKESLGLLIKIFMIFNFHPNKKLTNEEYLEVKIKIEKSVKDLSFISARANKIIKSLNFFEKLNLLFKKISYQK